MENQNLLIISDFNIPSGYQTITAGIAERLSSIGYKITVLGNGYTGEEHFYTFTLVPTQLAWLPQQVSILSRELNPTWILFIMDLEKSNAINNNLKKHRPSFFNDHRVGAIFPVESDPLCMKWRQDVKSLYSLQATFTRFGEATLKEANISSIFLPVGLDAFWYDESNETDRIIKDKYILFVADNQLRKNLPGALKMFKIFLESRPDYTLVLCTRPNNPNGWMLDDLIYREGLDKKVLIMENRIVSRPVLKNLYTYAGALLLPSLAEGIGLPIYEAQSQGCPVVATDCCSITEACRDKELLIPVDYRTVFNWGNVNHYWPNIDEGAKRLVLATEDNYQRERLVYSSWNVAADKLSYYFKEFDRLEKVIDKNVNETKEETVTAADPN